MHSSEQKQEEKACPCQKEGVSIPVTASAYIEKYCASDIYICKGQEQAGQYSYNYKTEDLVNASAMAFALAKQGGAVSSCDRIASWGIVA